MFDKKYIKCFSSDKVDYLKNIGFVFLYEQNGVYYFEDKDKLSKKINFSDYNFNDCEVVNRLNF